MSDGKRNSIKKDKKKNKDKPLAGSSSKKIKSQQLDTAAPKRYEDIHFVDSTKPVWNYSLFTEEDIRNFQQGTNYRLNTLFGSHPAEVLDQPGYYFAVWAPNATFVSVIGNFNDWNKESHPLNVRLERSGIWEGFIPGMKKGEVYKYHIHGFKGKKLDKGDRFHYLGPGISLE